MRTVAEHLRRERLVAEGRELAYQVERAGRTFTPAEKTRADAILRALADLGRSPLPQGRTAPPRPAPSPQRQAPAAARRLVGYRTKRP